LLPAPRAHARRPSPLPVPPRMRLACRAMREVVALCLQKEPEKRPTSRALLEHRFFKQAKDRAWVQKHLLAGLPPLAERVFQLRSGRGPTAASPQADSKKEIRSMARYIAGVAGAAREPFHALVDVIRAVLWSACIASTAHRTTQEEAGRAAFCEGMCLVHLMSLQA
jgi:hypothetical protein